MPAIHSFLVTSHIVVGAAALLLFWVPILATKGGQLHIRVGRIYVIAMYTVSVTAFLASVLALVDPVAIRRPGQVLSADEAARIAELSRMFSTFLLMLSVLVFSALRHGLLALETRSEPGRAAPTDAHPDHRRTRHSRHRRWRAGNPQRPGPVDGICRPQRRRCHRPDSGHAGKHA